MPSEIQSKPMLLKKIAPSVLAIQFDGTAEHAEQIKKEFGIFAVNTQNLKSHKYISIGNYYLSGRHEAYKGDWVVKDLDGYYTQVKGYSLVMTNDRMYDEFFNKNKDFTILDDDVG